MLVCCFLLLQSRSSSIGKKITERVWLARGELCSVSIKNRNSNYSLKTRRVRIGKVFVFVLNENCFAFHFNCYKLTVSRLFVADYLKFECVFTMQLYFFIFESFEMFSFFV